MNTLAIFSGGPLDAESCDLPNRPERITVTTWALCACSLPDVATACHVATYRLHGGGGDRVRYVYEGSRAEVPV